MSNTASGWIKLAKNSTTRFVACFTLANKDVVTFAGKMEQPVDNCDSAQASLTYNDVSDLTGTHEIDHADIGSYVSLSFDNSVRVNGVLDNRGTTVHTRAKGTWISNE